MSAQDDARAVIREQLARKDSLAKAARSTVILDALIAEGWRKIPTREEIIDALVGEDTPPEGVSEVQLKAYYAMRMMLRKWQSDAADKILALLEADR